MNSAARAQDEKPKKIIHFKDPSGLIIPADFKSANSSETYVNDGRSNIRSCPAVECRRVGIAELGQRRFFAIPMRSTVRNNPRWTYALDDNDWLEIIDTKSRFRSRDGTVASILPQENEKLKTFGFGHKTAFTIPSFSSEQVSTITFASNGKEYQVDASFVVNPFSYAITLNHNNKAIFKYRNTKLIYGNDPYPVLYEIKVKGVPRAWVFGWNKHDWSKDSMFSSARIIIPYVDEDKKFTERVKVFSLRKSYLSNIVEIKNDLKKLSDNGLIALGNNSDTFQSFARGLSRAQISYYGYPTYHLIDPNDPNKDIESTILEISDSSINSYPWYFLSWGIAKQRDDVWKKALHKIKNSLFANDKKCESKFTLNEEKLQTLFSESDKYLNLSQVWFLYFKQYYKSTLDSLNTTIDKENLGWDLDGIGWDSSKQRGLFDELEKQTSECFNISSMEAQELIRMSAILPNRKLIDFMLNTNLIINTGGKLNKTGY